MDTIPTSDLLSKLDTYRRNPNAIQRSVFDLLEKASDGRLNVIDPSNPFCLLLEASAVMSSDALNEAEALTRRTYPKLVTNEDELYGHISDMEYVGVWGEPSSDNFIFMFNVNEIKARAKEVAGTTNKKLTIPRETKVTIANADFGFAYPIDIIVAASGSISVLYDTTESSPFMALASNVLDYRIVNFDGQERLMFEAKGLQYSVTSSIASLSTTTGFTTTISIPNYLYHCRVYHRRQGETWEELATTHSGRVYDSGVPTATLKLHDSKLTVKVPEVYFNSSLMGVELRIDVYTTKGMVELSLGDYPSDSVSIKWTDLNKTDGGLYTSGLSQLTDVTIVGSSVTAGGHNGLTFEELRQRTVRNSTSKPAPVTQLDLDNAMDDFGYDALSVIDNVTDRTFLASKPMPAPTTGLSSSPIGTMVESIQLNSELLATLSTINYSNRVWSILPETLYKRDGTSIQLVSDIERDELAGVVGDELIAMLEAEEYFFNPFLTVLDTNDDVFEYNNYHIDQPTIKDKYFEGYNSKVDYKSTISGMVVTRTDSGYELSVSVRGEVGHEALNVNKIGLQLAFLPDGSQQRVYIEGVNHGRDAQGYVIFRFPIDTTFEILKKHELQITNFEMVQDDTLHYPILPDTVFDFVHYVTNADLKEEQKDTLQPLLGSVSAPSDAVVITHETANVRFFESLDGLINRSRVSVSSPAYSVWDRNVQLYYTEDVYERDVVTGHLVLTDNGTSFEPNLLHSEGELIFEEDGTTPVWMHMQGDFKLDNAGEKIPIGMSTETYFIDQILLDGRYRYATEAGTVEYVKSVTSTVVNWVKSDIASIRKVLLARTDLMFSPKTNVGDLTAYSVQGEPKKIDAAITVKVDLYVNYNAYSNTAIRKSIIASVRSTVIDELGKSEISTGSIHDQLRQIVGDDVITIKVHSFNGTSTLDAFIVDNDSVGCSLGKLLERQPDGTIALIDALEVNFIRHKN